MARRVEARRGADQVFRHVLGVAGSSHDGGTRRDARGDRPTVSQPARFQKTQVLDVVAPFLDRLADDATIRSAGRAAFDLADQTRLTDECRRVPARVSRLHPTAGFGSERLVLAVHFEGVLPERFAMESAARRIVFEAKQLDPKRAFQGLELGPHVEALDERAPRANLAHDFGVQRSGHIAHTGEDAASGFDAEGIDEFAAQARERRHVHQGHAHVARADAAVFRVESEAPAQIVDFGEF